MLTSSTTALGLAGSGRSESSRLPSGTESPDKGSYGSVRDKHMRQIGAMLPKTVRGYATESLPTPVSIASTEGLIGSNPASKGTPPRDNMLERGYSAKDLSKPPVYQEIPSLSAVVVDSLSPRSSPVEKNKSEPKQETTSPKSRSFASRVYGKLKGVVNYISRIFNTSPEVKLKKVDTQIDKAQTQLKKDASAMPKLQQQKLDSENSKLAAEEKLNTLEKKASKYQSNINKCDTNIRKHREEFRLLVQREPSKGTRKQLDSLKVKINTQKDELRRLEELRKTNDVKIGQAKLDKGKAIKQQMRIQHKIEGLVQRQMQLDTKLETLNDARVKWTSAIAGQDRGVNASDLVG